jgi:hypothetical protein
MFIVFITPCTFAAERNAYENQQYNFRMTLPDNWEISEAKNYLLYAISTSSSRQHFGLMGGPINPDIGVHEYETKIVTPYIEKIIKEHPKYLVKDKRHIVIDNRDANPSNS